MPETKTLVKENLQQPAVPFNVGSYLEAQSYFKSPYYTDSYYFPQNPDPNCRGNNYKIYDEMRDDDQVKVALSFKLDVILNSGWQIVCDDKKVKEFLEESLKRMQEDGSLQMSFEDSVRDIQSSAYGYGFGMAEPVFKLRNGMYVHDSIRVRPPHSFSFYLSDKGDVEYVAQATSKGEKKSDPSFFMHHVYQPEFGNPYGKSDLRGVFNSWKAKKFVTKFLAIYLERFATPTVLGRYPQGWDSDQVSKLSAALKTIQQATTLSIPENVMVEFVQANKDSSDTFIAALNYYNMHIARGLLVPDLLGISGEKTSGGSYALGQDQFKLFMTTVDKDRQSLARKITLRVVAPLVAANFGPDIKCDFSFIPYSMDIHTDLLKIWADVVKGNVFKPTPEEINHLRRELKFPEGAVELGNPNPAQVPGQEQVKEDKSGKQPSAKEGSDKKMAFCPTGPGGGIDPTCGKDSGPGRGGQGGSSFKSMPGKVGEDFGSALNDAQVVMARGIIEGTNDYEDFSDRDLREIAGAAEYASEQNRDAQGVEGKNEQDLRDLHRDIKDYFHEQGKKFSFSASRQMTSAERKVNFTQVRETLDRAESGLSRRLKRAARKIWTDYIKQIKESNLVGRFDPNRLTELKPRFLKDMNIELKGAFSDLVEEAYAEAKHELFPDKKFGWDAGELELDDMMDVLDAEAFNVTSDYAGLASKKVNAAVAQGLKMGSSWAQIEAKIREELPDASDTWIDTLVRTKTTEIYNRGRKSYFDNDPLAQQVIEAYQYSAILDSRTSEVCLALDKKVFAADDPAINTLQPPLHFNCRSSLVPVTKFERDTLDAVEEVPTLEDLRDMGAGLLAEKAEVRKSAFCPTGPGGGIDASCGKGSGKAGAMARLREANRSLNSLQDHGARMGILRDLHDKINGMVASGTLTDKQGRAVNDYFMSKVFADGGLPADLTPEQGHAVAGLVEDILKAPQPPQVLPSLMASYTLDAFGDKVAISAPGPGLRIHVLSISASNLDLDKPVTIGFKDGLDGRMAFTSLLDRAGGSFEKDLKAGAWILPEDKDLVTNLSAPVRTACTFEYTVNDSAGNRVR